MMLASSMMAYADNLMVNQECVKTLKNGTFSVDLTVPYGKESLTHKGTFNVVNKDCSTALKKELMPSTKPAFYLESMMPVVAQPSHTVTQISKEGVAFAHDFNVLADTEESVVLEYTWYVKFNTKNMVNTIDSREIREKKAVNVSKGDTLMLGSSDSVKIKLTFLGWSTP